MAILCSVFRFDRIRVKRNLQSNEFNYIFGWKLPTLMFRHRRESVGGEIEELWCIFLNLSRNQAWILSQK